MRQSRATIEVLQETGAFNNCKCIFHWFTGSVSERKLAIDNGAYFSINPKMLETKAGKDVIRNIPVDRILLETDAPFTLKCNSMEDLYNELERIAMVLIMQYMQTKRKFKVIPKMILKVIPKMILKKKLSK